MDEKEPFCISIHFVSACSSFPDFVIPLVSRAGFGLLSVGNSDGSTWTRTGRVREEKYNFVLAKISYFSSLHHLKPYIPLVQAVWPNLPAAKHIKVST